MYVANCCTDYRAPSVHLDSLFTLPRRFRPRRNRIHERTETVARPTRGADNGSGWNRSRTIFTPKKPFAGCEYRSTTRGERGAAGARRAEWRRRPEPTRDPAAPGRGNGRSWPVPGPPAGRPLHWALPAAYPARPAPARKPGRGGPAVRPTWAGRSGTGHLPAAPHPPLPHPAPRQSPAAGLSRAAGQAAATLRPRSPHPAPAFPALRSPCLPLAPGPPAARLKPPHGALAGGEPAPSPTALPPGLAGRRRRRPSPAPSWARCRRPRAAPPECRRASCRPRSPWRQRAAGAGRNGPRGGEGETGSRTRAAATSRAHAWRHHAATREEPARPPWPRPRGPLRAPDPVPAPRGRGRSRRRPREAGRVWGERRDAGRRGRAGRRRVRPSWRWSRRAGPQERGAGRRCPQPSSPSFPSLKRRCRRACRPAALRPARVLLPPQVRFGSSRGKGHLCASQLEVFFLRDILRRLQHL